MSAAIACAIRFSTSDRRTSIHERQTSMQREKAVMVAAPGQQVPTVG